MPDINKVSVTFTYDIADQYLYQTNNLKRTAQWTYVGPDKFWVFVDASTNKLVNGGRFHYTERDNGADVHTPEGQIKLMIDANVNPCMASLFHNEATYGELPHTEEALPDDTWYGHPDPIPPDHTYELEDIMYDPVAGDWVKPFPWKKPHVTWDDLKQWRMNNLHRSDAMIANCMPEDVPAWEEYRQKLRDLPQTFAGIDPWKVSFPREPGTPPRRWTLGPDPKNTSREG